MHSLPTAPLQTGPLQTESLRGPAQQFLVHGLTAFKPNHPRVQALRNSGHTPSQFGCRIWRASYLLIDYLSRQWWPKHYHVMELGSGWGLPSSYVQKRFGVRVTAQDVDHSVVPYQQLVSQANKTQITSRSGCFDAVSVEDLQSVSVIIGADICYSLTNRSKLSQLLARFAQHPGGEVVLADSGREPFMQLVAELGSPQGLAIHQTTIQLPTRTSGYILHLKLPL